MKISQNTCRLCTQEYGDSCLESVFNKDEEIEIAKKIFDISGVFIEKNDSLPYKICKHCKSTLQLSYEFRIVCQQSDAQLRAIVNDSAEIVPESKNIKFEVLRDDDEANFISAFDNWQGNLSDDEDKANIDIDKKDIIEEVHDDNDILEEELTHNIETLLEQENESEIIEDTIGKKKIIRVKKISKINRQFARENEFDQDDEDELSSNDNIKIKKNKKKKYLTSFQSKWPEKYNWVRQGKIKTNAFCILCNCEFSIAHAGESTLSRHSLTNKHMECANPGIKKENESGEIIQVKKENSFIMCEVCGNKYPTKRHLKRHLKYHSDVMDYECEICKKQFREMMQLKRHMRTHTGERPYACRFCDKRFGDYSTRIKHERVHKNERPYVCNTCGKAFTYANILKNHILVHTGEKPFKCEVCNTSFARKTHLKAHYESNLHKNRYQESLALAASNSLPTS